MSDSPQSEPPKRDYVLVALAGLILLLCTVLILRRATSPHGSAPLSSDQAPLEAPPTELAEMRPLEKPEDGFIGSDSCRECHDDEYATWFDTYHRTMTQAADPKSMIGDFNNRTLRIQGTNGVKRFHLRETPLYKWVEFISDKELLPGPEGRHASFPVVMTTGSHHMQLYWMGVGPGRTVGLLPFAYLREEQRWIPRRSAFLNWPVLNVSLEAGNWDSACIRCHTTGGQPKKITREGITHSDSSASEFGISCESCHGKAEEHVRIRRTAKASGVQPDHDPIVNPETISHQLSSQVCGSCHAALMYHQDGIPHHPGKTWDTNVFELMDINQSTRDYLTKHYSKVEYTDADVAETVDMVLEGTFWADGQTRLVGREYTGLRKSVCHTEGTISCTSCHKLHKSKSDPRSKDEWTDDLLNVGMRGDKACTQCHETTQYATDKHTHHATASSGSRCMNCHMPHTNYGLLKAARTHSISSPSVRETLDTSRPNACNLCHLDKTMSWTAKYLDDWYDIKSPPVEEPWSNTAASVVGALRGDASVRALTAWHFGWKPAREASGADKWSPPILTLLMDDLYDAVRFISHRSLKSVSGYQGVGYDFLAPRNERHDAIREVMGRWNERLPSEFANRSEILITADGNIDTKAVDAHIAKRDNRPISIHE